MATAAADPPPGTVLGQWIVAICAMTATLMQALDTTIATVALPYMQGSLAATPDQIIWVLTSYIVAAAVMTPPVGWLSARIGTRALLIGSLVGFTGASMLCGLASSLPEMVAFRIVQGIFGASLVPLSQSIMLDLYPPEKRGQAMAIWGMGALVGPVLGPTLGGYLTELYDWRWVFFVNLPFGIVATAGVAMFFRSSTSREAGRFDWLGFTALGIGVGALQLLLDRGQMQDWFNSAEIIIEAMLAGLGFYLFAVHTLTAERPLLSPRIFADINFIAGCLAAFIIFVILFATNALLAPFLQTLAGYPVEAAGLLIAPRGLGTMLAFVVTGQLTSRMDPRLLIAIGLTLVAYSLWLMTAWTPDVSQLSITVNAVLQGVGIGFVFVPISVVAFATLPPEVRTDGTASFNLIRNIGGAIGISVTSALLVRYTQVVHSDLAAHVDPFNRVLQSGGAYELWNTTSPRTLAALNAEITRQAEIIGYIDNFRIMMIMCLATLPLLLAMRSPKRVAPAIK